LYNIHTHQGLPNGQVMMMDMGVFIHFGKRSYNQTLNSTNYFHPFVQSVLVFFDL